MLTDPIIATLLVIDVFSKLNVPYLLGGSFASSIHGIPRATLYADIVADLSDKHAIPLVDMLKQDFYIDINMVRKAIQTKETFNIIHLETIKVQGERLDLEYLKTWANRLRVLDLLENALKEGG